MKTSREKKVRKIKSVSIIRPIIGRTIFGIVFIVAVCAAFDLWISGIEQRNCIDAYRHAEQAYKAFYEGYVSDSDNSELFSVINTSIPEVNGITVVRTDESYGSKISVSFSDMEELNILFSENIGSDVLNSVRADDSAGAAEYVQNGEISGFLFDAGMTSAAFNTMFEAIGSNSLGTVLEKEIPVTGLWFEFNEDGRQTLVNTDVVISGTEYLLFVICFAAAILFILLLLIYRIFSLINLFSENKCFNEALYTDDVTGESNWFYFEKKAKRVIRRSVRKKTNTAIVHLRMEKYRSFCTCFSVKEGQLLVKQLFSAIKKNLKRNEYAARYERADFALLLNYTDKAALNARIEQLIKSLEKVRTDRKLYFNAGVCEVENPKQAPETLYSNACTARSIIDDESEDCIAWFTDELHKVQMWEQTVESDAQRAIDNHEFALYLQPKYSAQEEQLAAAEALVRWNHPSEGLISPGRFIPIFESNGFITELDDYMLREISSVMSKWLKEGKKPVPVSVNISRANFTRIDLAEHITAIVDEYKVPHDLIELELTESAFFDDKKSLINTVSRLRKYGFPVSMDDFGTGYSSLNSLKEIPLDTVKLDAEFFRGGDSNRGMLIIGKTIDLAKELGMSIVAEGVETREQVDFLADNDCDLIQGYYFAKPMPVNEFEERAFQK